MMFWARYFPHLVAVSALCICGMALYHKGKSAGLAQARVECVTNNATASEDRKASHEKIERKAKGVSDSDLDGRLADLGILRTASDR